MNISPIRYKKYRCLNCNHECQIQTNHYDICFHYCQHCSWKAMFGEHRGMILFGCWHRPHECMEEEEKPHE